MLFFKPLTFLKGLNFSVKFAAQHFCRKISWCQWPQKYSETFLAQWPFISPGCHSKEANLDSWPFMHPPVARLFLQGWPSLPFQVLHYFWCSQKIWQEMISTEHLTVSRSLKFGENHSLKNQIYLMSALTLCFK